MNKLLLAIAILLIFACSSSVFAYADSSQYYLAINVIPPELPADNSVHPALIVQLLGPNGQPVVATSPILVYLTSSQLKVGQVETPVTIEPGRSFVVANFTSTRLPGITIITASSVGLISATASVKTVDATGFPTKLLVFPLPGLQPSVNGSKGKLIVESVDDTNMPAPAVAPIAVTLTSSNPIIAIKQQNLVIGAGQIDAYTDYTVLEESSSPQNGTVEITASASGYFPGTNTINVVKPINQSSGLSVSVSATPGIVPADGNAYWAISVTLENTTAGRPALAPSDVLVYLSSSTTAVAQVQNMVTIPKGYSSVETQIYTTLLAGTTTITASASNYTSSSAILSTVEPSPSKIALYVSTDRAIETPAGNDAMVVAQLQDGFGNPSNTTKPFSIILTANNSNILSSSQVLSIPVGGDYAYTFLTFSSTGNINLTASAQNLLSAWASLVVVDIPASLSVQASTPFTHTGEAVSLTVSLTLQGQPIPGANVTWSASNGQISSQQSVTNIAGSATAQLIPSYVGIDIVTVTVQDSIYGSWHTSYQINVMQIPQPTLEQRLLSFPYIVILIAVPIAVAAIVIVLFVMRRGGDEAEGGEELFGSGEQAGFG
ncbi:MAG: Ig-like domain-containing protein [Nitrososphaerota archaeon]